MAARIGSLVLRVADSRTEGAGEEGSGSEAGGGDGLSEAGLLPASTSMECGPREASTSHYFFFFTTSTFYLINFLFF